MTLANPRESPEYELNQLELQVRKSDGITKDIIIDTLTYLPVKSQIRFKCVCKLWSSSISDLKFVKSHLKRAKELNSKCQRLLLSTRTPQSVDFEAASDGDEDNAVQELEYPEVIRCNPTFFIGILGSCNGIICLFVDYQKLVLWNPSTRDSKKLRKPSLCLSNHFFAGLGYDSSYKFVIASCTTANGSEQIMVEVLTLKTNIWRKVPDIGNATTLVGAFQGIFCIGAVHWLGRQEIGSNKVYVIVAFDIADDKFKEVVLLPDHFDTVVLGMSGNCLCAFGECNGSYFEARIHDPEYYSKISLIRLFRLPADRFSQESKTVLCLTKKGELLLDYDEWRLELYHPVEDKNKCIRTYRDANLCDLAIYIQRLVSINDDKTPEEVVEEKREVKRSKDDCVFA